MFDTKQEMIQFLSGTARSFKFSIMGTDRCEAYAYEFSKRNITLTQLKNAFRKLILTHKEYPDLNEIIRVCDGQIERKNCGKCGGSGVIFMERIDIKGMAPYGFSCDCGNCPIKDCTLAKNADFKKFRPVKVF